ncbi:unnamed protein product [Brachionus calyciflorus]|uniref:Transposase Helix-turn-helix domain-containing protein n=1 Tax=Brachionus calyciflorus TaxID=104777 RepID=A0A814GZL7_9BILA|nr:unnamed protein product [Brachionus calyciflorus]
MPFKNGYFCSREIKIVENSSIKDSKIFEKFKDIQLLNESDCLKITGWTLKEFLKFSNFITSINETNGRTKEQLIALYRYWLRKGLDQFSLSLLFGNNTSQNQISSYLSQIREAIYKDFVPFFLGCNKER